MTKNQIKSKKDTLGILFWRMFFGRIWLYNSLSNLVRLICYIRGIKIGRNVRFLGFPRIRRHPYSTISIGNNCMLNSAKHSDFFSLIRPCIFVTLNRNAEIIFGNNVGVTGVIIGSASKVQIGNNVRIGAQCVIFDTDFHPVDPGERLDKKVRPLNKKIPSRPVTIEDNVFIGFNCLILKGVTIGENSVIGANSVVFNSIPKNSIAVGNPCKVIIRKNWTHNETDSKN